MTEEKTRRQLIEEMNYNGGINWDKMYPQEDERWNDVYVKKEAGK
jgi:hypothetical protein